MRNGRRGALKGVGKLQCPVDFNARVNWKPLELAQAAGLLVAGKKNFGRGNTSAASTAYLHDAWSEKTNWLGLIGRPVGSLLVRNS